MGKMDILSEALEIRDSLKMSSEFKENPIDTDLLPIPPFSISDDIKLIVIGQDPTIKNKDRRKYITSTLNLDKNGSIRNYIQKICDLMEIRLENVYGTNVFKYFYTVPPANTFNVLVAHIEPNLRLVKREIQSYPNAAVITLGEPILRLLTQQDFPKKMVYYWDYNRKTKRTDRDFKHSSSEMNHLSRDFFPFPHQPSIIKKFYSETLNQYVGYMRQRSS